MESNSVPGWRPASRVDQFARTVGTTVWKFRTIGMYVFLLGLTAGWFWPLRERLFTPIGLILVPASVLPIIIVMLVMRQLDKTSKEPLDLLFRTFLLGGGFAVLAAMVNSQFSYIPVAVLYFLVVGPFEEFVKLLTIRFTAYQTPAFDHAIDGVFYGIAAGAGFAAIENITYVVSASPSVVWEVLTVRTLLSTPSHALWGGLAGYFLGLAKFRPASERPGLILKGFLIAALVHGAYDWLVSPYGTAWSQSWFNWDFAGVVVAAMSSIAVFAWLMIASRHDVMETLGESTEAAAQ